MAITYTVKPGDTLSEITQRMNKQHGGNLSYQQVAQQSGISNPHLIRPGQTINYSIPSQQDQQQVRTQPSQQQNQSPVQQQTVQDAPRFQPTSQRPEFTPSPAVSQYDQQISDLVHSIQNMMNTPLDYDPYSSAEYAAMQAQAQRAGDRSIRAAQEAMGAAGFGRSTALADRAQNIQNDQNEYMMTQVVPYLIQQAEQQRQQEIINQMNLLQPLQQQQQFAEDIRRFDQQFQEDVFRFDQKFAEDIRRYEEEVAYRAARDAIADERWKIEFDEDVRRFGLEYSLNKKIQEGHLSVAQANAATNRARMEADRERLAMEQEAFEMQRIQQEEAETEQQEIEPFQINHILNTILPEQGIDLSRPTQNTMAEVERFLDSKVAERNITPSQRNSIMNEANSRVVSANRPANQVQPSSTFWTRLLGNTIMPRRFGD